MGAKEPNGSKIKLVLLHILVIFIILRTPRCQAASQKLDQKPGTDPQHYTMSPSYRNASEHPLLHPIAWST